ncbi:DUF6176 family protein [Solibacillus sp. CAU 1738]|uniref:DUF6176 family protein n=1 Tax=Solibacillus sp. CAU 1738 TaxID=3140363 RepID=UPI003260E7D6
MLMVECTRYRVKEGMSSTVTEWLQFLNANMKDVLVTLEQEKMYVETIFREVSNGQEFLYWYSVRGQGGIDVDDSDHWIDRKHLEYWDACIDSTYRPVDLETEVIMIPKKVQNAMVD